MVFKAKVSKEDFKRAYTECIKEAWILHSRENFGKAVDLLKEELLQYNLDVELNNEDDFNSSASSIDVFQTFLEMFEENNDQEMVDKWNKAWENEEGFDVEAYAGDSIEDGNAVGRAARELFDYFVARDNTEKNVNLYKTYDFSHLNFDDALQATNKLLKDESTYKYVYEAAFSFDNSNLRTRCDVLELRGNKEVAIYEVKATSKVKKEHFFDLAYQAFVLEKNGYKVVDMAIVRMNPTYVYGSKIPMDMKELGKQLEADTYEITYEEVLKDIKENNLLEKDFAEAEDDVDLVQLFDIDHYTYGTAKDRPTLMEQFNSLEMNHPISILIENIANIFALEDENHIMKVLNNNICSTKMSWRKKEGWVYGNYAESQVPYCYHALPYYDKNRETIFNFTGLQKRVKAMLFWNTGKVYLDDIPTLEIFPKKENKKGESKSEFSEANIRHFEVYKKFQKNGFLTPDDIMDENNINIIRRLLAEYEDAENVYMYDFETVKWAIPRFNMSKTYQQLPFQYSIDVIKDELYDYNKPETMDHYDFIETSRIDPRHNFIVRFIEDILLKNGKGVYVAYNKSFEKSVLKYLAIQFPKYRKPLMYVANHTIDLMDFFKGGKEKGIPDFLIYHNEFHGSYSIKKTQPALDGSFNYKDLKINKGDKAAQTFREFEENLIPDKAWEEILPWMIKYCNRDTLAMVVILKQVQLAMDSYEKVLEERQNEKI